MPKEASFQFPDEDELRELAIKTLELPVNKVKTFVDAVTALATTLDMFHREGFTTREAHKRILKSLRDGKKSLEKARSKLETEKVLLDMFASSAIANDLGSVLSPAGIRRLISEEPFFSFNGREVEDAARRARDGDAEWVIETMQDRVQAFVSDHPSTTLLKLLSLLSSTLDEQIKILSYRIRGRSPNYERDYMVERLLVLHDSLHPNPATTAPGGTFGRMCEGVLESFGQSDAGLASAVARIIGQAKRTQRW